MNQDKYQRNGWEYMGYYGAVGQDITQIPHWIKQIMKHLKCPKTALLVEHHIKGKHFNYLIADWNQAPASKRMIYRKLRRAKV